VGRLVLVLPPLRAVVEEEDGTFTYEGRPVTRNQGKMGKSLKNSISPDEVVEQYGCDTLRLYEMYMGPVSQSKTWSTRDIVGVHRFLRRLWRNLVDEDTGACRVTDEPASEDLRRLLHRTIAAVSEDMDGIHYNTALARLIELNNALVSLDAVPLEVADPVLRMLAPQAPHIAEELWERMGGEGSVCLAAWPEHDPAYLVVDEVEIAVQVTGKKRAVISVPVDAAEEDVVAIAKADENVARHLEGKTVRKVIYVPGRLLNIVAT
jgi:leucyl-tRNA synthetase